MRSNLLINEPPLVLIPTLAVTLGVEAALFLQQVHYWLNPKFHKDLINGRPWVYNSYKQWKEQFPFWSDATIRRIVEKLESAGVLESFTRQSIDRRKYYTINYDVLDQLFTATTSSPTPNLEKMAETKGTRPSAQNCQMHLSKSTNACGENEQMQAAILSRCYTETTSETPLPPPLVPPLDFLPVETPEEEGEEEDEEDKFNSMILVWNEIVQKKLGGGQSVHQDIRLTPHRREALQALIAEILGRTPGAWEALCTKIAGSRFLMGQNASGFKVAFDWAVKPANALKILEDAIYDKPQGTAAYVTKSVEDMLEAVKSHGLGVGDLPTELSQEATDAWLKVCRLLIDKLGQAAFTSWFGQAVCLEFSSQRVTIQLNTGFIRDHIEHYFRIDLERAVQAVCPEVHHVVCTVGGQD